MTWGAAILETLSAIWRGVKTWQAKRAAADLAPGQAVVDQVKKDTQEIDRLAEGAGGEAKQ